MTLEAARTSLLVPILVLVALVTAVGGLLTRVPLPTDEAEFLQRAAYFKREYRAADSNRLQSDAIAKNATEFFDKVRDVNDWYAVVVQVNTYALVAEHGEVTFHLNPIGEAPSLFFALRKGDPIRFNGVIEKEVSISNAGMILDPEMRVALRHIERD